MKVILPAHPTTPVKRTLTACFTGSGGHPPTHPRPKKLPAIPDSRFPDLQDLCFQIPDFQICRTFVSGFQVSRFQISRNLESGNIGRANLESGNLGPANLEFGISGSPANLEIWNLETCVVQRAGNQEIQTLETSRRRSSGGGGEHIYIYTHTHMSVCILNEKNI